MLRKILVFVFLFAFAVTSAQAAIIMVPGDEATIQDAVDAASAGDQIVVLPGTHSGAEVNKAVEIIGLGNETKITTDIEVYKEVEPPVFIGYAAFYFPSDGSGSGATISNLEIVGDGDSQWGILARNTDDVTLSHLSFTSNIGKGYAIQLTGTCNGWKINHNKIDDWYCGIFCYAITYGSTDGGGSHLIAFNKMTGCGVFFMAERNKAIPYTDCKIVHNTINNPASASLFAIIFWDKNSSAISLRNNDICFNDLRGSYYEQPVGIPPALMSQYNTVSRNLGENRAVEDPHNPDLNPSNFNPQMP